LVYIQIRGVEQVRVISFSKWRSRSFLIPAVALKDVLMDFTFRDIFAAFVQLQKSAMRARLGTRRNI